jgi:hypothetical protein
MQHTGLLGRVRKAAAWEGVGRRSGLGLFHRKKSKGFWFSDLNWFQNLARLWEFLQGVLKGILTQPFFLDSSRILKDFLENTIWHAMNAPLSQIKLRKSFS